MDRASDNAMHQHRHDVGEYRRIELITGAARRRRWTAAEKAALVTESVRPGVNISDLARRSGVNRGLLQTWRRTAMRETAERGDVFVPLRIQDTRPAGQVGVSAHEATAGSAPMSAPGVIELESGSLRVRFSGSVDTGALRVVLAHLGRRA
jgi:transposase